MSLIAELKRRNVFRVGVAYVIGAWVIAQAADLVLDNIEAPDWVMQAIMLVLAIGLPLALILAWAFELTPEGVKRETAVDPDDSITHATGRKFDFAIIGLLAVALIFVVVDNYVLEAEPEQAEITTERAPTAESDARKRSIAVLPFVNMSSDPEQEYFSDGLSEEILNLLAKIPDLKVIGRTSSFAFKGKNEDLRGIGQALGVSTVLEGSVRKSGSRVRVTAQLIDVSDGSHIWSDTYDRTMTDIFAVQDDVASSIIDALHIHVGATPTRGRPTENEEAYTLFLKARAAMNRLKIEDAKVLLLESIELDPSFAEAHQQLAYCYWWNAGITTDAASGQKRMYDAAVKAIDLDPNLLFAHAFRAAGTLDNDAFLREIEALERVTREQPSNAEAREALISDLLEAGYYREALRVAEQLIELDPLSGPAQFRLSQSLRVVGRASEAVRVLEFASELGIDIEWTLGRLALLDQRDEDGIAHFETFLDGVGRSSTWVRDLVTHARNPESGQAYLDQHIPQIVASMPEEEASNTRYQLSQFYLNFGFLDRYFELIFASEPSGSGWSSEMMLVYDGLTSPRSGFIAHPRFLEVAEATGLIHLWEKRGPPDFCEKLDGQWICE